MNGHPVDHDAADLAVQIFPLVIGKYSHLDPLDVEAEVAKLAAILADFGGELSCWDVDATGRGMDAVLNRLTEWGAPQYRHHSVFYWAGHGWSDGGSAALACADSQEYMGLHSIQPFHIAEAAAHREKASLGRDTWAVIVIDACQSKRFAELLTAFINSDGSGARRVMIVGTSGEGAAWLGGFTDTLERCLRNDFGGLPEIHLWRLSHELAARMPQSYAQAYPALANAILTRRYPVVAGRAMTVDVRDELEARLAELPPDERRHFIPKAQGGAETSEVMWFFQGRHGKAGEIAEWLRGHTAGLLVVTGRAGSGKSALLGYLLAQSRPQLRDVLTSRNLVQPLPDEARLPENVFDAALLLTGASVVEVVTRLADMLELGTPPASTGIGAATDWLIEQVGRLRPGPAGLRLTVLLDALDEAQEPLLLAGSVLRRLAAIAGVRVIVGTRGSTSEDPDLPPDPSSVDLLDVLIAGGDAQVVTVDREAKAIVGYVRLRLAEKARLGALELSPERIEELSVAVAGDAHEFLFARLAVHEIIARPELLAPEYQAELQEMLTGSHRRLFARAVERLSTSAFVNAVLLEALALGLGRGLPSVDHIWSTVAEALDDSEQPNPGSIDRGALDGVIRDAAPYLIIDTSDGQTVYRLAHQTFREHFLDTLSVDWQHRHLRVAVALIDATPADPDRPLNPYVLRNLSGHVTRAGLPAWQHLNARPDLLDRIDQTTLCADAGSGAFGLPDLPPEIVGVIGAGHLLPTAAAEDRRGLRQLAAARSTTIGAPVDPDPRTAAWSVAAAAIRSQPIHRTLVGHSRRVLAVAAVSVGARTLLAAGGDDGTLRLWDPATATPIADPIRAHGGWVWAVTSVPVDGKMRLATGGDDGTVRLWDPATVSPVGPPMRGHTGRVLDVTMVRVSGRVLLASRGGDGRVLLWNPGQYTRVGESMRGHTGGIWAVAPIQLNGKALLAIGGVDGTVRLWDPAAATPVGLPMHGHTGRVLAVAQVPSEGQTLLASSGEDGGVCLWDPATTTAVGSPIRVHNGSVWTVAAVHTGRRALLASGGDDGTIRLWDPTSATAPTTSDSAGHPGRVRAVAQVGTILATGGDDGTVRLWDRTTATPINAAMHGHAGPVVAMAAVPMGERVLLASAGNDSTVRLWDPATATAVGSPMGGHTGPVLAVTAVPVGDRVLLASGGDDGTLRLWDAATATAYGKRMRAHTGPVLAVATFAVGNRVLLATGGKDGTLRFWDPANGTAHGTPIPGFVGPVSAVAAIPVGEQVLLAIGGDERTLRLWDPVALIPIGAPMQGHTGRVLAIAAVPVGERVLLASGGDDATVSLWDATTAGLVHTIPVGFPVAALTGGIDGLTVGGPDGIVRIRLHANVLFRADAGQGGQW